MTDITVEGYIAGAALLETPQMKRCACCNGRQDLEPCAGCGCVAYCCEECAEDHRGEHAAVCAAVQALRALEGATGPRVCELVEEIGGRRVRVRKPFGAAVPKIPDGAPHVQFALREDLQEAALRGLEHEEHAEADLDRLMDVIAGLGRKEIVSSLVPLADIQPVLHKLINPEEPVLTPPPSPKPFLVILFYPFQAPLTFPIVVEDGRPLSRADVLALVSALYRAVYAEPTHTLGQPLFPLDALFLHSLVQVADNIWTVFADA